MHDDDHRSDPAATDANRCRHGLGRRTRLTIGALVLLGIGAAGGALVATAGDAFAHGGFGRWHRAQVSDEALPAHSAARVRHGLRWLYAVVDASDEQRARIDTIADEAVADLAPLAVEHRARHRDLAEALGAPEVDREALEALRTSTLSMAEAASTRLTAALADAAEVLDSDQRAKLAGLALEFRR